MPLPLYRDDFHRRLMIFWRAIPLLSIEIGEYAFSLPLFRAYDSFTITPLFLTLYELLLPRAVMRGPPGNTHFKAMHALFQLQILINFRKPCRAAARSPLVPHRRRDYDCAMPQHEWLACAHEERAIFLITLHRWALLSAGCRVMRRHVKTPMRQHRAAAFDTDVM